MFRLPNTALQQWTCKTVITLKTYLAYKILRNTDWRTRKNLQEHKIMLKTWYVSCPEHLAISSIRNQPQSQCYVQFFIWGSTNYFELEYQRLSLSHASDHHRVVSVWKIQILLITLDKLSNENIFLLPLLLSETESLISELENIFHWFLYFL